MNASLDICQKFLGEHPEDPEAHYRMGLALTENGHEKMALHAHAMAYALIPGEEKYFLVWKALATKYGTLENLPLDADIVFTTGGFFLKKGFHALTPSISAIGGSESALIAIAKELALVGKRVAVYCNCDKPGTYDGVTYLPNFYFAVANRLSPPPVLITLRFPFYLRDPIRAGKKIFWVQDIPNTFLYRDMSPQTIDLYPFDSLFCVSHHQTSEFVEQWGVDAKKCYPTRNGFDVSLCPTFRENRNFQIIYASRPYRGLDVCLKVFKKLRGDFPQLELIVCGYTQEAKLEQDEEIAPLLPLLKEPGIRFSGELTKQALAKTLSESLFMLYPNVSTAETSCMAAIESMAAGTPVVTSDRGALPETVPHEKAGIIVPYDADEDKLVENLRTASIDLLQQDEKRHRLSRGAFELAHSHYSWKQIALEWLQFLKI